MGVGVVQPEGGVIPKPHPHSLPHPGHVPHVVLLARVGIERVPDGKGQGVDDENVVGNRAPQELLGNHGSASDGVSGLGQLDDVMTSDVPLAVGRPREASDRSIGQSHKNL